ncbi:BglG family transcription antiterminator [Gottfriedia luciferensis]|uniref:BglG family transcription antiterminator n=1 Tax=Gottfriedia luciferensis TaxID=178774 RepID=UPI000B44B7DE|nr:HTH domain-containing protein [Gottfriedia luciferensis]
MLTVRELQIVTKLLDARSLVRIKDLSDEFQVSTRTIKYDLENVRSWFKDQSILLHSQTNKGLWVDCDDLMRKELRNQLTQIERFSIYPDQSIRVKRITMLLLLQNEYLSAAELAEKIEVSRNTILSDLNHVEEFVESWMIQLERKQRTGYRLVGQELNLRVLLEHLIFTSLNNYQIYKITTRIMKNVNELETDPILEEQLQSVYSIVEKHMQNTFTSKLSKLIHHSDLLRILIRLTISIMRMNMGTTLKGYRLVDQMHYDDDISIFVINLMEKIFNELRLPMFEDEYQYISGGLVKETESINLVEITEGIIKHVSLQEGINYYKDSKLYSNLFAHLTIRFQKGAIQFTENNPFTDEIKRNQPSLFKSIQEACHKHIQNQVIAPPDSFIAFIALHFLVSYENTFQNHQKARALYVCSTGRGVAKLIKNRVEKEIKEVEFVTYCSILEVEEICKLEEIDLIVSVFPIESDIPVVVVEAVPTKRDLEDIQNQVTQIVNMGLRKLASKPKLVEKIQNDDAEAISQEILLKGFEISHEILGTFHDEIEENRKSAFMLHIFLMVHRYYFNKQYDQNLYSKVKSLEVNGLRIEKLKQILEEKEIQINETEMITLCQYLK